MKLNEKNTRLVLKISLWLKSFFAITEIAGGLIFYFVSQNYIVNFIYLITRDELTEDPKDFISHYLVSLSHSLTTNSEQFIALYLLFHGLIKMAVIISLLKNKIWSYPVAIVIFTTFIVYQLYRFYFTHSVWLMILTLFDLIIIWLVWREYKLIKKNRLSI